MCNVFMFCSFVLKYPSTRFQVVSSASVTCKIQSCFALISLAQELTNSREGSSKAVEQTVEKEIDSRILASKAAPGGRISAS